MARRTDQRRAAVWALYQSDLLERPVQETFPRDAHSFTRVLASEVKQHQPELDALITRHANGWTLGRIAPLERSILRVGLFELAHSDLLPGDTAIPAEGAINEAVETAKQFCGADAPAFINGILGAALRELQGDAAAPAATSALGAAADPATEPDAAAPISEPDPAAVPPTAE